MGGQEAGQDLPSGAVSHWEGAHTHRGGPIQSSGECFACRSLPECRHCLGLEGEALASAWALVGEAWGIFKGWHSPDRRGGLLPGLERKVVPALNSLQDG